jgi:hypothetical protein
MNKQQKLKQAELIRLVSFALELELSKKVCVFIDMSGHVSWLQITIAKSKKEYKRKLGHWMISYDTYYDNKNIPVTALKKSVDKIILEMKAIVNDLDTALKLEADKREAEERAKLEELKAKYEV